MSELFDMKYDFEQRDRQGRINDEIYNRLVKLEKMVEEVVYLLKCQGASFDRIDES